MLPLLIGGVETLLFDRAQALLSQVFFKHREVPAQLLQLLLFQGSPSISIHTTGPFAGAEIANELFLQDLFRYDGLSQLKHLLPLMAR
jgi:hypothetical protein